MAYLYRHVRLDTNLPFYIGIGNDEINYKRAFEKDKRSQYWKNIILKTQYKVDIVLSGLSYGEVLEKEKEFIKLYGRLDLKTGSLCNLTDGGEGVIGYKIPVDSKKYKFPKNNTPWNKGKTWNKKLFKSHLTASHKENISRGIKNSTRYNRTLETNRDFPIKIIEQRTKSGKLIATYSSIEECSKALNTTIYNVIKGLNGKHKQVRGYILSIV